MPFDSEFHIPIPRLLLGLIIVLVPITIFGLYIGLQASHQTQEMNGAYFRSISRGSASMTSQYIAERVSEVVQIANLPYLQQAVTTANRAYENVPEATIRTKAEQIESRWGSADSAELLKNILGSEVAKSVRRHHELNPKLLSIWL